MAQHPSLLDKQVAHRPARIAVHLDQAQLDELPDFTELGTPELEMELQRCAVGVHGDDRHPQRIGIDVKGVGEQPRFALLDELHQGRHRAPEVRDLTRPDVGVIDVDEGAVQVRVLRTYGPNDTRPDLCRDAATSRLGERC